LYQDEDFRDVFPRRGQPAEVPWRLALVTLMHYAEGLTDRQEAFAVRTRIDWKYVLSLELTDRGFDFSVLSEFRGRLLAHGAERRLLERVYAETSLLWLAELEAVEILRRVWVQHYHAR
jgi:transposase